MSNCNGKTLEERIIHAKRYLAKVESVAGKRGSDALFGACCALFDADRIGFTREERHHAWDALLEWNRSGNARPRWDEKATCGPDSLRKKFDEALSATDEGTESQRPRTDQLPSVDEAEQASIISASRLDLAAFRLLKPTSEEADAIMQIVYPDGLWPEDMSEQEEKVAVANWEHDKQEVRSTLPDYNPKEPVWRARHGECIAPLLSYGCSVYDFETDRRDRVPWADQAQLVPSPCRSWVGC
jgi:hypothetical protein